MKKTNTSPATDLQKFIEKFQPLKFKMLKRGIEIRGSRDLHRSIGAANALIGEMKLNLTVHHSADMASYGGFEVNSPDIA